MDHVREIHVRPPPPPTKNRLLISHSDHDVPISQRRLASSSRCLMIARLVRCARAAEGGGF